MTTDFRTLCAELADALGNAIRVIHHEDGTLHISTAEPVLERARAALAEPKPEPPTDDKLFYAAEVYAEDNGLIGLHNAPDFARAVLARWGS